MVGLAAGDAWALFAVTWIGFGTHGENLAGWRWLATFVPLCAAWALAAPRFGLFRSELASRPLQVWRVLPAMILAVPLAVILRAFWLDTAALPIFAAVLTAFGALGMALWRLLYAGVLSSIRSRKTIHG
jgi:hypothetical protein